MATIVNVETSSYYQTQQQIYAQNKIGQFSKFLNKNPVFVTYYVVNQAQSTADPGTGVIDEEIGPKSPLRFNKVTNVPVYNMPDLKPDVEYDDAGYDLNMDINDLTFLPSTVRPKPADYMKIEFYGVKPLLFRCNNYRHNTIMSNDFYMADFDIRDIKNGDMESYIDQIEHQVVETYSCHFENIGTNNKVLISSSEEATLDDVSSLADQLKDFYLSNFYNQFTDSFVLYSSATNLNVWYYDVYLAKFINESGIFEDDSTDDTLVLPYNDLLPLNFDYQFTRTMWYAVLQRSKDYLNPYNYYYRRPIQKRTSPFILEGVPCDGCALQIMGEYIYPQEEVPFAEHPHHHTPCINGRPAGTFLEEYFKINLAHSIIENKAKDDLDYIETLVYTYITKGIDQVKIDKQRILQYAFTVDLKSYMYLPIVIYILQQKINNVLTA